MALYLSRLITVPMAELASATQEISRGNLAYRVRVGAQDEIGALVDSFNLMADELEHNRQELEARRRYTETILENTPSAVLSLNRRHHIERANAAVERLFGSSGTAPRQLGDLFDAASLGEIQHLLRKSDRWPQAAGQIEVHTGGRRLTLAATAAALSGGAGYVLVLDDLTDLLHIQRAAAWREVARRIAHEIKNPLTPIALSAERIQRRLAPLRASAPAPAVEVVSECAAIIASEVGSLQRLVDEFSTYARFPHTEPVPCDLNDIIERALRAFDGRLEGIEIRTRLDPLPALRLDPEAMKRAFINLIDNAAEAMHHAPYRQLTLATQQLDGVVEAVVADTGHGLPSADKQRLFLPYYSTKQRGTGLGLAIVLRIVEENGGSLRAEDNTPIGARFIMELPLKAPEAPVVETVADEAGTPS
jgi:nitrogen fixation/metabolism regulation signal transduction histidine kinase